MRLEFKFNSSTDLPNKGSISPYLQQTENLLIKLQRASIWWHFILFENWIWYGICKTSATHIHFVKSRFELDFWFRHIFSVKCANKENQDFGLNYYHKAKWINCCRDNAHYEQAAITYKFLCMTSSLFTFLSCFLFYC